MGETLFLNGNIISMDASDDVYKAVLIRDGKIAFAGSNEEALKKADKPEIHDLNGKTVLPGFIETHLHLVEMARSLIELDMKPLKSREEFELKLKEYSLNVKKGEWVLGAGWSELDLFDGIMPQKSDIDKIVDDKPVCLVRQDGHSLVLNSLAIQVLTMDNYIDTLNEKVAPRDSKGELNGMFYEEWVFKILGMIMEILPEEYMEAALVKANHALLSNGITCINDIMTQFPSRYKLYKRLQEEGKLNGRIICGPLGGSREFEEFIKLPQDDKLSRGPVKYFMDGSFGSKTALLFKPYKGEKENCGIQTIPDDKLYSILEYSLKNNEQLAIHAIGDLAVAKILDQYERAFKLYPNKFVRNRIEHIQIIRDEDIIRFKKLGIIASFQPVFNLEVDITLDRIDDERIKDTYRYKTFIDRGVKVIFNGDCPFGGGKMKRDDNYEFVGFEPLLGIHTAVNSMNLNKNEVVSLKTALKCYTCNSAFANFASDKIGTIEVNKYADMIVLSSNPFETEISHLKDIKVEMTIVNGEKYRFR